MNKIKDIKIKDFILRYQVLDGLDTKELRNVIDLGKKEIKKGIVLAFTITEKSRDSNRGNSRFNKKI